MNHPKLRVAFLIGGDSSSTRRCIEAICSLPGVETVGILLDMERAPLKRRLRNLVRNIRANGWMYPFFRCLQTVHTLSGVAVANAAVGSAEIEQTLRAAFPERCFSLPDVAQKWGVRLHHTGNLNAEPAIGILRECRADLGIVLGTRILKPGIFSVPRLGCINLHKGKVPDYRGMPPGVWELYDGAPSAGITVHFVDKGLDTGDIVATGEVPIAKTETPDSLLEKLHEEGVRVLVEAVSRIRAGNAERKPQPKVASKPRTKPTLQEWKELQRRLPHWKPKSAAAMIGRNLYLLLIYYSGVYFLVRQYRRMLGRSRGAIYLYHRVNDYSQDVLTVDTWTFAGQLLAISRRYPMASTAAIVDHIRTGKRLEPTTVAIHFDDCYRDIHTEGAPILKTLGIPACAFINSGFIGTERVFSHDEAKYPFQYPKLLPQDVREWSGLGLEVGAHTVNHVNLGRIAVEDARFEIVECGNALEKLTGKRIDLFSFPFGRVDNISEGARKAISDAGYSALFAAHGGFIGRGTDPYDIPRMGASCESPPVYCLVEIEGLALNQVAAVFRRLKPQPVNAGSPPSGKARGL